MSSEDEAPSLSECDAPAAPRSRRRAKPPAVMILVIRSCSLSTFEGCT